VVDTGKVKTSEPFHEAPRNLVQVGAPETSRSAHLSHRPFAGILAIESGDKTGGLPSEIDTPEKEGNMSKKKVIATWRILEEIPEEPQLALYWIEQKPGFEHIMLQGIDDEEYAVQVMQKEGYFHVSVFDPHEVVIDVFNDYGE